MEQRMDSTHTRSMGTSTVQSLDSLLFSREAQRDLFRHVANCELSPGLSLTILPTDVTRLTWRAKHGVRVNAKEDMLIECVKVGASDNSWGERATVLGNFLAAEPKDGKQVLESKFLHGLMKQGFRISRLQNISVSGLRLPLSLAEHTAFADCRLSMATTLAAKTLDLTRVTFDDAHIAFQVEQGVWSEVALQGKKSLFTGSVGKVCLDRTCAFRDCSIRADFRSASLDPQVQKNSRGYSMTTVMAPEWFGKTLIPIESSEAEERRKVTETADFKASVSGTWHQAADRSSPGTTGKSS